MATSGLSTSFEFEGKNLKVKVSIGLYLWEEDGIHYAYAPALDLIGYGESLKEAKDSFEITLEEYIRYTQNKGTLFEDLENLGWTVNRKKRKVKAPSIEDIMKEDTSFKQILDKGNYRKEERNVQLA